MTESKNPVVLVVDDEGDIIDLITDLAEQAGFVVRSAATGEEALDQAKDGKPCAVISDLGLPGMGGIALLRQLREKSETTSFVIVSGSADTEDVNEALRLDVAYFLEKPISRISMKVCLRTLYRIQELQQEREALSQKLFGATSY